MHQYLCGWKLLRTKLIFELHDLPVHPIMARMGLVWSTRMRAYKQNGVYLCEDRVDLMPCSDRSLTSIFCRALVFGSRRCTRNNVTRSSLVP